MNIELIKKYKKEFDYLLEGGRIQVCFNGCWGPGDASFFNIHAASDYKCVMHDEYVEFRKALADGKTIQFNFGNYGTNKEDFPDFWKDLDSSIGILSDRTYPQNYRIKPEEPEFKVGDWVRVCPKSRRAIVNNGTKTFIGIINVIDRHILYNVKATNNTDWFELEDILRWKPRVGELVVMYAEDYSTGFTVTTWEENSKFIPVPFTGELPK